MSKWTMRRILYIMPLVDTLTDRQNEILKLIRELTEVSGYPPTRAEIAERMGFRSVNAAEQHLRALEKKGAIEISSGASRGMSMRDAGIIEGDLLAVHRTQEARTGQVVVARLADEVTVKRFRRRGHTVQLLPENPDFDPIEVDLRSDALVIEGIAVGVIRNGRAF